MGSNVDWRRSGCRAIRATTAATKIRSIYRPTNQVGGVIMANDIVAGLFGLSPYQVQQQQQAAIQQQAQAYAQQDPFQRAAAGMYQGGAGLGMLGAQAAGMVNPEVEAAKQREAIMGGVTDMQTPQGLRALAAKFQAAGM